MEAAGVGDVGLLGLCRTGPSWWGGWGEASLVVLVVGQAEVVVILVAVNGG